MLGDVVVVYDIFWRVLSIRRVCAEVNVGRDVMVWLESWRHAV